MRDQFCAIYSKFEQNRSKLTREISILATLTTLWVYIYYSRVALSRNLYPLFAGGTQFVPLALHCLRTTSWSSLPLLAGRSSAVMSRIAQGEQRPTCLLFYNTFFITQFFILYTFVFSLQLVLFFSFFIYFSLFMYYYLLFKYYLLFQSLFFFYHYLLFIYYLIFSH